MTVAQGRSGVAEGRYLGGPGLRLSEVEMAVVSKGTLLAPPPPQSEWEEAWPSLTGRRLAGQTLAALRALGVAVSEEVRLELKAAARWETMSTMCIDEMGRGALEAFLHQGVPFVVVKGPAMARHYPDPVDRAYSDLDVLVSPGDFEGAMAILQSLEYQANPDSAAPRPWFDRLCREGVNLSNPHGGRIDLHHRLAPWAFSRRLSAAEVLAQSEPGRLAGLEVPMASTQHSLVIAALHLLNDLWKRSTAVASWADIVTLLDAGASTESFERYELSWLPSLLSGYLEGRSKVAIGAIHHRVPFSICCRLWLMGWYGPNRISEHSAGWVGHLPIANSLAYTYGNLVPSRDYIEANYVTYRRYWRNAFSERN